MFKYYRFNENKYPLYELVTKITITPNASSELVDALKKSKVKINDAKKIVISKKEWY